MKCPIGKIGILFVKFPFSGESLSGGKEFNWNNGFLLLRFHDPSLVGFGMTVLLMVSSLRVPQLRDEESH
jgi:hypothetical protein